MQHHDQDPSHEGIAILKSLICLPEFEESRKPRIIAMMTLRNFAMHFSESSFLDLEKSILGQWCLRSLHSSVRELRVCAGYGGKV